MSKKSKTWMTVVVIVLIIIAGSIWLASLSAKNSSVNNAVNNPSAASASNTSVGLTTSPSDNSNAALESDMNSVNTQMNNLNSDSANINQGMSAGTSSGSTVQ